MLKTAYLSYSFSVLKKSRLILLGALMVSVYAYAIPPGNDLKVNAFVFPLKDHWTSNLQAYNNTTATNDGSTATCGAPNSNVWFKFQATTQYLEFKVLTGASEGTMRGPGISLWNSSDTEMSCVTNSSASSTTDVGIENVSLTIGEWYYVSVQAYSATATYQGTFTIYINDQPSVNVKLGALELTQKNNWCSPLAAYSNVGATADGLNSACGTPSSNVWFKFQAATAYIKLDVKTSGSEGTISGPEIALWNSSNLGVTCANSTGSTGDVFIESVNLIVGEWYFVSVYTSSANPTTQGTFSLCVNDQPSYDHKMAAIELTQRNNWCSALAVYSNVGATQDGPLGSCGIESSNVWFKFQATTPYLKFNVKTSETEGTVKYPGIVLWNNNAVQVGGACYAGQTSDVSIEKVDLTIGEWYYLVVTGYGAASNQGTFSICINDQAPFDHKVGALELTQKNNWCSAMAIYSNVGATRDGAASACGQMDNNVWFKFQAATTYIKLEVKTGGAEGTLQYAELSMWNNSGIEMGCTENTGATNDIALERGNLTIGEWYYVSVYNGNSWTGTFGLCVNDQPTYNYKEGALLLSQTNNWCSELATYSTTGATADGPASACGTIFANVWFKFQAVTPYIKVDVKTGSTEGTAQYLRASLVDNNWSELNCISGSTSADVRLESSVLTVGQWYYISVNSQNSSYRGTFSLCATDQPTFDVQLGALELTQKNNWCSPLAAYSTVGATPDGPNGSCGSLGANVWFKFQAATPYIKLDVKTGSTEGTAQSLNILLWDSNATQVACVSTSSTNDAKIESTELIVGQWYYLSVNSPLSNYQGTFSICANDQPTYDHKVGAVNLSTKNWCSNIAVYSNVGATLDGPATSCASMNSNVWFKFQATTSYIRLDVKTGATEGTIQYPEIALFSSAGTAVACQNYNGVTGDIVLIKSDMIVGEWYHISVFTGLGSASYQGTFTFCVYDEPACLDTPLAYSLSTTQGCFNSSSGTITLANSQTGVTYMIESAPATAQNGLNGQPLTWGGLSPGSYKIMAARGTCNSVKMGEILVTEFPKISQTFTLSPIGTTTVCQGTTVPLSLNGSVNNFKYQLRITIGGVTSNVSDAVKGTGSGISFKPVLAAGEYSVQVISITTGCTAALQTGKVTIATVPTPLDQSFIGPTVFCPGTSGITLQLENSESDVIYQLNGPGAEAPKIGGGMLSWQDKQAGTYSVTARRAGICQIDLSKTVTITTGIQPDDKLISANAVICEGESALISINESQSNVLYQVKKGSDYFGLPVIGNGSSNVLPLARVAAAGSYQVEARSKVSGCTRIMSSNAMVTINPIPLPYLVEGGGALSESNTAFPVTLSNSETGTNYQLLLNDQQVASGQLSGNNNLLTWASQSTKGSYSVKATNSVNGCTNMMNGSATVFKSMETIVSNLAFQYKYDSRRRMIGKKVPGAEWVWMVYDKLDRVVLTQDGEQKKNNKWSYIKYDAFSRPVMTGIYTHATDISQHDMSDKIEEHSALLFEEYTGDNTTHGYTARVWPNEGGSLKLLTATYYDSYGFIKPLINNDLETDAYDYDEDHLAGLYQSVTTDAKKNFPRVTGQVTGIKMNILDTEQYLYSINYFDERLRLVQNISQNHKGGRVFTSNIYDFVGKVIETKRTYDVNSVSTFTWEKFTYDPSGRLLTTRHGVNGPPEVTLVNNAYNELGQLTDKMLHSTASEPAFKQSIDYSYNIRGWLTKINETSLESDDDSKDLFGMQIAYNDDLLTGNANSDSELDLRQYNGNISAIKWSSNLGLASVKERAYNYSYDVMSRVTGAEFKNKTFTWATPSGNAFSESGYEYDLNGNILALIRKGSDGSTMDNLKYTYYEGSRSTRGNRLLKVADDGDDAKGFADGINGGHDYAYDANGNMTTDKNKDISEITYNVLNLPLRVTKQNGDYIEYMYNAAGGKISQTVREATKPTNKVTDYLGELIYENDVLQMINHSEGRVIKSGQNLEYQYHLKDHLGNVRTTFTSKPEIDEAKATYENATTADEKNKFLNFDGIRFISHTLFDHTYNLQTAPVDGPYAQRLSGNDKEKIGLARSISVMPGDKISIEVFAKYFDQANSSNEPNLAVLMNSLINGVTIPGIVDGLGYSVSSNTSLPFISGLDKSEETGPAPKAYLNWVVFDRHKHQDMDRSGYKRVTTQSKENGSDVAHDWLKPDDIIEIAEPGYVYIWLSNENETPIEVYFDDFKVTQIKSPVIQTQDYYPFGLAFNSYQRENSQINRYKFNGKELQDDLNIGWMDYGARMFVPEIGRWIQLDPYADLMPTINPYSYAFNSPINFIEKDGRIPIPIVTGLIGAAGGGIYGLVTGKSGKQIAALMGAGFVAGATLGFGTAAIGLAGGAASITTATTANVIAGSAYIGGANAGFVTIGSGVVGNMAGEYVQQSIEVMTGETDSYDKNDIVLNGVFGLSEIFLGPLTGTIGNGAKDTLKDQFIRSVTTSSTREQNAYKKELVKQIMSVGAAQGITKKEAKRVADALIDEARKNETNVLDATIKISDNTVEVIINSGTTAASEEIEENN